MAWNPVYEDHLGNTKKRGNLVSHIFWAFLKSQEPASVFRTTISVEEFDGPPRTRGADDESPLYWAGKLYDQKLLEENFDRTEIDSWDYRKREEEIEKLHLKPWRVIPGHQQTATREEVAAYFAAGADAGSNATS